MNGSRRGAQVSAAIALIEQLGAIVAGIATICMDRCPVTSALRDKYAVRQVWSEGSRVASAESEP